MNIWYLLDEKMCKNKSIRKDIQPLSESTIYSSPRFRHYMGQPIGMYMYLK